MTYTSVAVALRGYDAAEPSKDPIEQQIRSFGRLRRGWDFGAGVPASERVVECAVRLYEVGSELGLETEVFPGTEGEIAIAFYRGELTLEVIVNRDGTTDFHVEAGEGFSFVTLESRRGQSFREVTARLLEFSGGTQWNTLESSTQGTLVFEDAGFRTSGSRIPRGRIRPILSGLEESPFSLLIAPVTG